MPRLIFLLMLFCIFAAPARAGESASAWVNTHESKVRLVAAGERRVGGETVLLAGVQMKMAPGWKTYWRMPGDAGLPPSFDWSGSRNLKQASLMWPAPERVVDPAGTSVVYHDEVVFPVTVEAADPDKPVRLALEFEFAICKDICVPADAKLSIDLNAHAGDTAANGELVAKYLERVPRKGEAGEGPSITAMDVSLKQPKPHITIDAKFPPGAKKTDLFVEGPEDVYIALPERVSDRPDGGVRYKIDLNKGEDPAQLKGKTLVITLISAGASREVTRRID